MDEELLFGLIVVLFLLLISISISFVILYAILKNKKLSIAGLITGLPAAFVVAYAIPINGGEGIMSHLVNMDIVAKSAFDSSIIMVTFFGTLTAFMGLVVIKIKNYVSNKRMRA
ncbi:hypothetical protein ACSAZL_09310 [Methanosarcina sp. T3]|uniref:hypothetical protein n=1 Tax=Methanosarcina sp. T3 TaxID=3439062 RepID=UPI003F86CB98